MRAADSLFLILQDVLIEDTVLQCVGNEVCDDDGLMMLYSDGFSEKWGAVAEI